MMRHLLPISVFALAGMAACLPATSQTTTALRATELRADKLGSAAVVATLAAGAALQVLGLEGGWAWVESAGVRGWARANALNLQSGSSAASGMDSGRQAAVSARG